LKFTDGFTRLWASIATAAAIAGSMVLLSLAARQIPIGTAYPAWVGIGAVGAAICGTLWLGEPFSIKRLFFVGLLIVALVGLKATSGPE
jgi:quaternary ammonium compound-resistance protein SugE